MFARRAWSKVLFSCLISRQLFRKRMTRNEALDLLLVSSGEMVVCAQL